MSLRKKAIGEIEILFFYILDKIAFIENTFLSAVIHVSVILDSKVKSGKRINSFAFNSVLKLARYYLPPFTVHCGIAMGHPE